MGIFSIFPYFSFGKNQLSIVFIAGNVFQEKFKEANTSLELGLSYNLQVRDQPLYHVLLGAIQRYHGDTAACAQSMRTALSLNTGHIDYRYYSGES